MNGLMPVKISSFPPMQSQLSQILLAERDQCMMPDFSPRTSARLNSTRESAMRIQFNILLIHKSQASLILQMSRYKLKMLNRLQQRTSTLPIPILSRVFTHRPLINTMQMLIHQQDRKTTRTSQETLKAEALMNNW